MNVDNILDGLFPEEELIILEYLKNLNIAKLKTVGNVQQLTTEKDGVTETITNFTSFDGKYNFTKTNSFFSDNAKHRIVTELNQQIAKAVDVEDYELAAKLKERKDLLLNS